MQGKFSGDRQAVTSGAECRWKTFQTWAARLKGTDQFLIYLYVTDDSFERERWQKEKE